MRSQRINYDFNFWKKKCFSITNGYDRLVERLAIYENAHNYLGKNAKVTPVKIKNYIKFSEYVMALFKKIEKSNFSKETKYVNSQIPKKAEQKPSEKKHFTVANTLISTVLENLAI